MELTLLFVRQDLAHAEPPVLGDDTQGIRMDVQYARYVGDTWYNDACYSSTSVADYVRPYRNGHDCWKNGSVRGLLPFQLGHETTW